MKFPLVRTRKYNWVFDRWVECNKAFARYLAASEKARTTLSKTCIQQEIDLEQTIEHNQQLLHRVSELERQLYRSTGIEV